MKSIQIAALALATVALTACGSVPKRKFQFDVIDTAEQPLPAMIIVENQWSEAASDQQFVNVTGDNTLELELTFKSKAVMVTAVPISAEDGKPTDVPQNERQVRDFKPKSKTVLLGDAGKQLFILERQ